MENELSFIKLLRESCKQPRISLAIGDDAACFSNYLITTDVLVEHIHFTMQAGIKNIIFKLFTSNVSDIAAMGGSPLYALLTISILKNKLPHKELIAAIREALEYYGIYLIGGDTTGSPKDIFLSLTLIGKKNPFLLTRSNAKPGDLLFLSRPTGLSLISLENELYNKHEHVELFYHYKLPAEKELGKLLGKSKAVTSCIDISDGLGVDANHLSEESKVKIIIEAKRLPVDHLTKFKVNKIKYAITSGEEYALLFTINRKDYKSFINELKKLTGREIYMIGYIEEGSGVFLKEDEKTTDISKFGYIHEI